MSRLTRLALSCYPPSWQERYGEELADLADGQPGAGLDLLLGAARAWLHPLPGRTTHARRLSAICTTHVAWCAGFVGSLVYLKQVNDPPVPGLTTGLSQPLWGVTKAAFFFGWLVLVLGGTGLLLRVGVPAVRQRSWHVLRPMLPAAVLMVVVLGSIPLIGSLTRGSIGLGTTVLVLAWLGLGLALAVAGAVGPAVALRRSQLPAEALAVPVVLAGLVGLALAALALVTAAEATLFSDEVPVMTLVPMWGGVALIAASAAASLTSLLRVRAA